MPEERRALSQREPVLNLGPCHGQVASVQRVPRVQIDEPKKALREFPQRVLGCLTMVLGQLMVSGVPFEVGQLEQYAQSIPLFAPRQRTLSCSLEQRTSRFEIAGPMQRQSYRGNRLVVGRHRGGVLHCGQPGEHVMTHRFTRADGCDEKTPQRSRQQVSIPVPLSPFDGRLGVSPGDREPADVA